jgi:hypothetical protein
MCLPLVSFIKKISPKTFYRTVYISWVQTTTCFGKLTFSLTKLQLTNTFLALYEPESALLSSQELDTCPYPEPQQYSPDCIIQFLDDLYFIYTIYALFVIVACSLQVSSHKFCVHLSPLPCKPHTQPLPQLVLLDLIVLIISRW